MDDDNSKPKNDDAVQECGEHCDESCECDCHDAPDFEDRVVQGLSDMISKSIEDLISKLNAQVSGLSVAIGAADEVGDPDMQRCFLMATYDAMITHASAARALLASACGVDDDVMADRASLMLDIGRAEVSATEHTEEGSKDAEKDEAAKEGQN